MAQFQFHQHITLARKYLKPKPISLVNQQIQMQYLYNRLLVANYIENSMLVCILDIQPSSESQVYRIKISQLKFLYPLKTLAFPAFSPPRFGPFPSFFPLREEMRETFFRPSLQPYPAALRKFAWPLWWRGRKCSLWYLHQNVPAAPAHPWVLPREREGWSYMYASTDGNENHPYPRSSFGSIGIRY